MPGKKSALCPWGDRCGRDGTEIDRTSTNLPETNFKGATCTARYDDRLFDIAQETAKYCVARRILSEAYFERVNPFKTI